MLRQSHPQSALGYFDMLQPEHVAAFREILLEIDSNPSSFFSVINTSFPSFRFCTETPNVTLSSETDLAKELDEFAESTLEEWQQALVTVAHSIRTPNLGLKLIGAHRNERLNAFFDNENGICEISATFREGCNSGAYLLRLATALNLAERPKKASRYIPEWLETKLLCDSMHLCNICREPGVIIHHIIPIEEGGLSEDENLIVLCLNHHSAAHSKSILSKNLRPEHLRDYKRRHNVWTASRGSANVSI